jgi:hypothetical protein
MFIPGFPLDSYFDLSFPYVAFLGAAAEEDVILCASRSALRMSKRSACEI